MKLTSIFISVTKELLIVLHHFSQCFSNLISYVLIYVYLNEYARKYILYPCTREELLQKKDLLTKKLIFKMHAHRTCSIEHMFNLLNVENRSR